MNAGDHMAAQLARAKAIEAAPESAKRQLSQAFSGVASPRGAIKATCLQCCGFDREAVRNCSGWSCPLHFYRPFQERDAGAEAAPSS